MTPKERHRAQALTLRGGLSAVCCLTGFEGHECGGRLQAHHTISAQRLAKLFERAREEKWDRLPLREVPAWVLCMRITDTLDEVIADGRNAKITCEVGHRQIELGTFEPEPDRYELAFATDYALTHLLGGE